MQQLGETSNAASRHRAADVLKDMKVRYGYTIVDEREDLYKLEIAEHVPKSRGSRRVPISKIVCIYLSTDVW